MYKYKNWALVDTHGLKKILKKMYNLHLNPKIDQEIYFRTVQYVVYVSMKENEII